jgi:solute carrier family 35, member F1/2
MLLDCFTIPVALGLTWFFLKTKYNWRHLLGVALCLGGLGTLVYDDAIKNGSNNPGLNPLVGDLLCLLAATLYAVSNVGQEATVKKFSREEFLAMVGIYGTVINGIQLSVLALSRISYHRDLKF